MENTYAKYTPKMNPVYDLFVSVIGKMVEGAHYLAIPKQKNQSESKREDRSSLFEQLLDID